MDNNLAEQVLDSIKNNKDTYWYTTTKGLLENLIEITNVENSSYTNKEKLVLVVKILEENQFNNIELKDFSDKYELEYLKYYLDIGTNTKETIKQMIITNIRDYEKTLA